MCKLVLAPFKVSGLCYADNRSHSEYTSSHNENRVECAQ